jgi:hypothetical protein
MTNPPGGFGGGNFPQGPVTAADRHYADLLDKQYPDWVITDNWLGANVHEHIGQAFIDYMRAHPKLNPKDVYTVMQHQLKAIGNLGKTIGGSIATGATVIGKAGLAAGTGVAKASQDIFHGLNLANLLIRLGEIVLGIVLVGVGVAKVTGASNVISKAVRMPI